MSRDLINVDWSEIPCPIDDGMADHLHGIIIPSVELIATDGKTVNLSKMLGITIIYAYPRIGVPGVPPLFTNWDQIPGARGCTPQSCAFRDHFLELQSLGVSHVFGLSVQDTNYQKEAVERLHLPFTLLSDVNFALTKSLKLPTFGKGNIELLKRITLVIKDGIVVKVFYPVFPPDKNAEEVINWLKIQE